MSITAFILILSNPAYQFDQTKELLGEKFGQGQSVSPNKPLDEASA